MTQPYITEVHLKNFKGFQRKSFTKFNAGRNILIGGNDTGKSSLLLAIDLVLSANPKKIESLGLDRLLNQSVVASFLAKAKKRFTDLPEMEVDVFFSDMGKHEFCGEHNILDENRFGMYLLCRPREDLKSEIEELLSKPESAFPFEYYTFEIKTCSGATVSQYRKPLQHITIDNTKISNDYASKAYVRSLYEANTERSERNRLKYLYRESKNEFSSNKLTKLNEKLGGDFTFSVKNNSTANLETDLTILASGVDIENAGVGTQCFIRTNFALSKKSTLDLILLEEPENHLSHVKMGELISVIENAGQSQIFIATHSSLIASRLGLDSATLLGGDAPIKLDFLSADTAAYFKKAPNHSLLEFVLSKSVFLVEGDAEYMMMEHFFGIETSTSLEEMGVHVISVGGISFPRFLEVARQLNIRVAVITDNDGDYQANCVERYKDFDVIDHIKVFSDTDKDRNTFEKCVYRDNPEICDRLFLSGRRSLSVEEYMLKNKSEAAFQIALDADPTLTVPNYIKSAIEWLIS